MRDLKVWGRASSSNVQAVMWGLAEMGVSAERVDLGEEFGGLDAAWFRAMNPNGLIPVVRDGDGPALFESAAILRCLGGRYGRPPFWPDDPTQRAEIDMWAEWGKYSFGQAFTGPIFWAHWRTPEAARDRAAIAAATTRFEARMEIVAQRVGTGGFMVADAFSLADIWVGHVLHRYFTLDIDRAAPGAVEAYYQQLCERPAYQAHVMLDYSDMKGVAGSARAADQ